MELAVGPPLSWETRSMKLLSSLFLDASPFQWNIGQQHTGQPSLTISGTVMSYHYMMMIHHCIANQFMHISCSYYINHSWFKAYASLLCEWHIKVRCSEDENDFLSISGNCSLRLPKLGQELYSCEVMWIPSKQFKIQCVYYQVDKKKSLMKEERAKECSRKNENNTRLTENNRFGINRGQQTLLLI